MVPKAVIIGALTNPANASDEIEAKELDVAANALGLKLLVVNVSSTGDIDKAFATFAEQRADALFVHGDSAIGAPAYDQIMVLAARYGLPAVWPDTGAVRSGGLISYSAPRNDVDRLAGVYTGRILKGEKPADLPVTQPTRFELAINLKTAKALGLSVPPTLLAIADEVIE